MNEYALLHFAIVDNMRLFCSKCDHYFIKFHHRHKRFHHVLISFAALSSYEALCPYRRVCAHCATIQTGEASVWCATIQTGEALSGALQYKQVRLCLVRYNTK